MRDNGRFLKKRFRWRHLSASPTNKPSGLSFWLADPGTVLSALFH
jgi:hypothetical protein